MDTEDEVGVGDGEEKVLSAASRAIEATAVELGQRRVERLQGRDVGRPRVFDRSARDERVELAHPGFHLG